MEALETIRKAEADGVEPTLLTQKVTPGMDQGKRDMCRRCGCFWLVQEAKGIRRVHLVLRWNRGRVRRGPGAASEVEYRACGHLMSRG